MNLYNWTLRWWYWCAVTVLFVGWAAALAWAIANTDRIWTYRYNRRIRRRMR